MLNKPSTAFQIGTSSVFIVGSPFQALCAIEAIRHFAIDNYEVLLTILKKSPRDDQVRMILDKASVNYKEIYFKKEYYFSKCIEALYKKKHYQRVFVGNPCSPEYHIMAMSKLSKHGDIVYLDDGNLTLPLLYDKRIQFGRNLKIKWFFTKIILSIWGGKFGKNFFTIFSDVTNQKYMLHANTLSNLLSKEVSQEIIPVVFIGTNPDAYCAECKISYESYLKKLKSELTKLRESFCNEKIYYIPHGRDDTNDIYNVCNSLSIEICKINVCIEYYFIKNNLCPRIIIGVGSTALFTLKRIFPESHVRNLVFFDRESKIESMITINNYYESHGIQTEYC